MTCCHKATVVAFRPQTDKENFNKLKFDELDHCYTQKLMAAIEKIEQLKFV